MKYKIVWLINGFEGFGVLSATLALAIELRVKNIQIDFISIESGKLVDALKAEDFKVITLNKKNDIFYKNSAFFFLFSFIKNFKQSFVVKKELQQVLRKKNYTHLIYGNANLTSIVSLLRIRRLKKIFLMHNVVSDSYFLNLNKLIYQFSFLYGNIFVIANSYYTASTISGYFIKPKVLHLGINTKKFDTKSLKDRNEFKILNNDIVFGVFARWDASKAQDVVIESFKKLIDNCDNINLKLLLIGANKKDDFYHKCLNLIKDNNLSSNVIILREVNQIEKYYSLIDVLINSRINAEPFGLTVIEAMYNKVPVIALNIGGPSETILDSETGWLIDSSDSNGYYKGMYKAIQNKDSWFEMGNKGKKRVLEKFTTEIVCKNFLKLISEN